MITTGGSGASQWRHQTTGSFVRPPASAVIRVPPHSRPTARRPSFPHQASRNIGLQWNGIVRGRVLGADQRPVQTHVDLLPVDSRTELFPREGQVKLTNASGEFEFGVLPPGDYLLGVNLKRPQSGPPYPPTYYPGTTDRADAQVIHVGEGTVQENVDFVLPRALAPGRVIVTSPALPGGTVFACVVSVGTYRQPAPGEPIAVHVVEGVRYRLRLHVEDPAGKHWESELIEVEGKAGDHTAAVAGFRPARTHPENNECYNEALGDSK